ncbi:hypothetical protein TNCT_32441 [Trichonephila clavata]|uniref:Uncharacterized protein n=1 Tax=Trichonephila clavata TaxID=2740835 RepID=A0A8X6G7P8_TRICU|nr:hypothetical protein TNCT_32441 [Trichonephila clavata]
MKLKGSKEVFSYLHEPPWTLFVVVSWAFVGQATLFISWRRTTVHAPAEVMQDQGTPKPLYLLTGRNSSTGVKEHHHKKEKEGEKRLF